MNRLDELLGELRESERTSARPLPHLTLGKRAPSRVVSRGTRVALSSLLAAAAFAVASPGVLKTLGPAPFAALVLALGVSSSFALGATSPGESRRIGPVWRALIPAFLFAGVVGVLLGLARYFSWVEFVDHEPKANCLAHSLFTASLVTLSLFAVWRRTDPFSPRALGAYHGALGGVLGALCVTLSCPSQEGIHLLLGHGFATILFATVGALAGRRFLSP